MRTPITVQIKRRIHVAFPSDTIMEKHTTAPAMQVNHGQGVLNGRGRSGRVRRSTSTPRHTVTNAARVPIETISPRSFTGNNPPMSAAESAVMAVPVEGVLNLG